MTMIRTALIALALSATMAPVAQSATVGTITFNDNAWADNAYVQLGVGQGDASNLGDDDISTGFQLLNPTDGNATVGFSFTDNILFNGDGFDLVIFSGSNNNNLHVGFGPDFDSFGNAIGHTDGQTPDPGINVGAPGNTTGFGLAAQQWDLSFFGYAPGEIVTEDLFVSMGGIFGTVWGIAALNSMDPVVTTPQPVPLPAGGWLLLAGLGALAATRRKTKTDT